MSLRASMDAWRASWAERRASVARFGISLIEMMLLKPTALDFGEGLTESVIFGGVSCCGRGDDATSLVVSGTAALSSGGDQPHAGLETSGDSLVGEDFGLTLNTILGVFFILVPDEGLVGVDGTELLTSLSLTALESSASPIGDVCDRGTINGASEFRGSGLLSTSPGGGAVVPFLLRILAMLELLMFRGRRRGRNLL